MKTHSRYSVARGFLVFWTLFIGLGAVAGALCMLIDPSGKAIGMDAMLPYFNALPFSDVLFKDFTFSGWALLIVNGLTNLVAAILLLKNNRLGILLGGIFGVTLMLWICIQFYMFPFNFMSTAYFVFGFIQAVTAYAAYVFRKQEEFTFDLTRYSNVGSDKSKLVVYFSRMGYTRTVAYELADKSGADILEIKATEKTDGTLGFWWCGRFGMHGWDMPIEEVSVDLSAYREVTVCSPIWVFSLSAPVKSFLRQAQGKINVVNYVFVHYTDGKYVRAAATADSILGIEHRSLLNVRSRQGRFKYYE